MISIGKNLNELDRCHQSLDLALDCYVNAIRNASHYAIELDPQITAPHREYLRDLADRVAQGEAEVLTESRATLRGLLRDYRDKAAEYVAKIRDELTGTARALQEITEAMTQSDDDHEARVRSALLQLRALARSTENGLRDSLAGTANTIEQSLEQIRKQNQITLSQFLTEIRMLHQRIDALEAAASIDDLTKLFNRAEMEDRIRSHSGGYCLLLIKAGGLRIAAVSFSREVSSELTGAFTKRLRNSLPEQCIIGRWAEEDFVAILPKSKSDTINHGKFIAENLGGSYACLHKGKTVRPLLKLRVGVVDSNGDKPERVLERIAEFL